MRDGCKIGWLLGEVTVDLRQFFQTIWLHEPDVANVQEVVTAGSFNRPVFSQKFSGLENFFSNDPCIRSSLPQSREILQRIAQAVGMVDPNTIQNAFAQPIKNSAMRRFKDVWSFNPETDKSVHVEEPAVAQFLVGGPPIGQPVMLKIQQFIKGVVILIQFANGLVDRLQCLRMLFAKSLQEAVDDYFVAMPGVHCRGVASRQVRAIASGCRRESSSVGLYAYCAARSRMTGSERGARG